LGPTGVHMGAAKPGRHDEKARRRREERSLRRINEIIALFTPYGCE
jgi:hypothetical protein